MSIVLVNPDGTSNAKVGDLVITGGGIYEKTSTGSRFVQSLKDYIGADKTQSRRVVEDIYKTVTGVPGYELIGKGNGGTLSADGKRIIGGYEVVSKVDDNGIVTVSGSGSPGYDPNDYAASSTSGGLSGSKIAGYAIIGLVGLAVLDRFVGGSGK